MLRRWHFGTALAAFVVCAPVAIAAPAGAPGFSGDRDAVALVARANRSYVRIPAVRIDAVVSGTSFRFTLFLRNGVTWAEQARVRTDNGEINIVGTIDGGSFVKDAGASCWRFVAKSDPQAMEDLGDPVLAGPGRLGRPRRAIAGTIEIMATQRGGERMKIVLDRRTLTVRRVTYLSARGNMTARFTTLRQAPTLPRAQPRC
jgi:hypothetical protein